MTSRRIKHKNMDIIHRCSIKPKRNNTKDHTKVATGDILSQVCNCDFDATNNEAEYEALIIGLQLAKDLQIKDHHVYFKSLLITNHFNGSYAVKGESLALYLQILKNLASKFKVFGLNQLPREDNDEVDALANLGSSLRIPPETMIAIVHMMIPTNRNPTRRLKDPNDDKVTTSIAIIDDLDP